MDDPLLNPHRNFMAHFLFKINLVFMHSAVEIRRDLPQNVCSQLPARDWGNKSVWYGLRDEFGGFWKMLFPYFKSKRRYFYERWYTLCFFLQWMLGETSHAFVWQRKKKKFWKYRFIFYYENATGLKRKFQIVWW